jgi:hypothetical protein
MSSPGGENIIPVRLTSPKPQSLPANQDKVEKLKIKKRKTLHKSSQSSLDPLRDIEYWDHQVALIDCDKESIELWAERAERKLIEMHGSVEDFRELSRSAARQRVEKEVERRDVLAQREKLGSYLKDHASGLKKSLHDAKEAFLLVLNNAANDGFRPGPRSYTMQTAFRRKLIQDHHAKESRSKGSNLWCPVLAKYMDPEGITAAHIFPYRMGEDVMVRVFGEDSANEMFSARNGLLLHHQVEKTFDKFLIAIVPAGEHDPRAWKLRVLDKSILKHEIRGEGMTWTDLDNKELIFKGNARPAARYLYYHYCIGVTKLANENRLHNWKKETSQKYWATPGKYIRAHMLKALAERMGHGLPDELDDSEHTIHDVPTPKLEDKVVAAVIMESISEDREFGWERLEEDDKYEDDDDDRFRGRDEEGYTERREVEQLSDED